MGLDNGFWVKSNRRQLCRKDLPSGLIYTFDEYSNVDETIKYKNIEIIYWRKNWGLRNAIIDYFDGENDSGIYEIDTPEQIDAIVGIIFQFLDRDVWDNEGESIWEFEHMKPTLHNNIVNLLLIKEWMKTHQDIYVEFYDSY